MNLIEMQCEDVKLIQFEIQENDKESIEFRAPVTHPPNATGKRQNHKATDTM